MSRRYWVDIVPTAVTAYTVDILELGPIANKPIKLIAINLHQTSDFGDAQDEILSLKWVRGNTSGGSGGNAVTPVPCDPSDTVSGFTAESFNSTAASGGTEKIGPRHGFNVRAGLERPYAPEEQMICTNNQLLCLRLEASPADSITIGGSVCVEEMG